MRQMDIDGLAKFVTTPVKITPHHYLFEVPNTFLEILKKNIYQEQ